MVIKSKAGLILSSIVFTGMAMAKPIPTSYSGMENGHVAPASLQKIAEDAAYVQKNYTPQQYQEIVEDPYNNAKNDKERVAAIAAREIIFMVDRSGSMSGTDDDPTGKRRPNWTLWKSAKEAAISLFEVSLALDANGQLDVFLWSQEFYDRPATIVHEEITQQHQIETLFNLQPKGGTPLAEALEHVYQKKLKLLLQRNEPFTVVVLTDGMPSRISMDRNEQDPQDKVYKFFRKLVSENRLDLPGRETLAAFSFIQAGDDIGAENFLTALDDNLIEGYTDSTGLRYNSIGIDIVDYKKDNFIFGTGTPEEMIDSKGNRSKGGPMAVFWDAMFD